MKTFPLLAALCAVAAGTFLTGCEDYDNGYRHHRHAAAYDRSDSVDFYYTSGRPYSRAYGPLVIRDGRYYYSRGGSYVTYDRPTTVVRRDVAVRRDYDGDRRDVTVRRDYDGDRRYSNTQRRTIYPDARYDDATDSPAGAPRAYSSRRMGGETGTRVRVIER